MVEAKLPSMAERESRTRRMIAKASGIFGRDMRTSPRLNTIVTEALAMKKAKYDALEEEESDDTG